MGRKKIQIKKIEDQKLKTITFTRRRNGLLKKAYELSVLCDTRICVLMFDSKEMAHVYCSVKEDKDAEAMMSRFLGKSFTTTDPRRKYDTSPDLQLDETQMPWRVNTQENNVAIVNTYTVQPNTGNALATPGPTGTSPGDDDDDGDGLDQLSVKSQRSYYVNEPSQKSAKKGSAKSNQGVTPPISTTLSPPIQQRHLLPPGELPGYSFENCLDPDRYEGFGVAQPAMAPQRYTMSSIQYIPQVVHPSQSVRYPVQMAPLQSLEGNPHVQRPQPRMVPMPMYQTLPSTSPQVSFPCAVPIQLPQAPPLVLQQSRPLPQMVYDEDALLQAGLVTQMRQQQSIQQQQQQQRLPTAHAAQQQQRHPSPPRSMPKPISRSLPSSPEKRRFANQLAQVSKLDLSISAFIISSALQQKQTNITVTEPPPESEAESAKGSTHLRGLSFLDELFEMAPQTPKGPLAPDGTLWEIEEDPGYDEATLEADMNAWLQSENLTEGSEWLK